MILRKVRASSFVLPMGVSGEKEVDVAEGCGAVHAPGAQSRLRESGDVKEMDSLSFDHLSAASEANHTIRAVHRLNLFPLTHLNFLHMFFNMLAIAPLLERFEAEFGTIVTLSLFTGRKKHIADAVGAPG